MYDLEGHTFVVHNNKGERVSCGVLTSKPFSIVEKIFDVLVWEWLCDLC